MAKSCLDGNTTLPALDRLYSENDIVSPASNVEAIPLESTKLLSYELNYLYLAIGYEHLRPILTFGICCSFTSGMKYTVSLSSCNFLITIYRVPSKSPSNLAIFVSVFPKVMMLVVYWKFSNLKS